jgi:hypothetical protein
LGIKIDIKEKGGKEHKAHTYTFRRVFAAAEYWANIKIYASSSSF